MAMSVEHEVKIDQGNGLSSPERKLQLRRGLILEAITVGWNIIEGIVALIAGSMAGSIALIGFGIDSFIETASAVVVGWRLADELAGRSEEQVERIERITGRIAGALLLLLAVYILYEAGRRLLGYGEQAQPSVFGMIITSISVVVMPVLAWAKLRTAKSVGSKALKADAYETIACTWLSATTLVGLVLNAAFGWWWADPVAALILVPLVSKEGFEAWKGECCVGADSCGA